MIIPIAQIVTALVKGRTAAFGASKIDRKARIGKNVMKVSGVLLTDIPFLPLFSG